jgi:succinate dehydrogenase hydrophobic anchor subunit
VKESTLRRVVYATGLAAFALLAVHLALVFAGPGDLSHRTSYAYVQSLLNNWGYFVLLGALLVVSLTHAFLGLRRTLLDANVSKIWFQALAVVAAVSTSVLLYLYLTTA